MKKMFLLFSHKLTQTQKDDAIKTLGIDEFVYLPENLQILFSNIPSDLNNLDEYLLPIKDFLKENSRFGDVVLIQGDFGAVYHMVNFSKNYKLLNEIKEIIIEKSEKIVYKLLHLMRIYYKTKDVEILDKINEILSSDKISEDEAKLIVQLMKKKGWNDFSKVNFNDSNKEFIKKIRDEFENKKDL
mgnify:CR=1 FL=1